MLVCISSPILSPQTILLSELLISYYLYWEDEMYHEIILSSFPRKKKKDFDLKYISSKICNDNDYHDHVFLLYTSIVLMIEISVCLSSSQNIIKNLKNIPLSQLPIIKTAKVFEVLISVRYKFHMCIPLNPP